jgi:hypothetical protein
VAIAAALLLPAVAGAADQQVTRSFPFTGAPVLFVVPDGITSLHVHAVGGAGGDSNQTWPGGTGADVVADLAVTPGDSLWVLTGGNGSSSPRTAGAYNGGGASTGPGASPGGGASDIRTSVADLSSRLVVAGAGGGAAQSAGGNAGEAAPDSFSGGGGGTDSAGGAAGANFGGFGGSPAPEAGTFGQGGAGGRAFSTDDSGAGGGGGGGGWYGGGGAYFASGGGGGSSHAVAGATNVAVTADATRVPVVELSYDAPIIDVTTPPAFPQTAQSTVSPSETVTVTNVGGLPLHLSGIEIAGTDADDFFISADNCGATLQSQDSCALKVRFVPSATGSRSAVLQISSDGIDPVTGDPTAVTERALAGEGGALPQGPAGDTGATGEQGPAGDTGPTGPQGATGATGAAGATGATGPQGATGATGQQGPAGPRGARGPRGKTPHVTCKAKGRRITCKVKPARGSAASHSRWTLTRKGRVVAHGRAAHGLRVNGLKRGRYVLRVTSRGVAVKRTLVVRG